MSTVWVAFWVGCFVGALAGVVIAGLCVVARPADDVVPPKKPQ